MQGHNYHWVVGKGDIFYFPRIESILGIQNSDVLESNSLKIELFGIEIEFHALKK
jgi:hypothetical protein